MNDLFFAFTLLFSIRQQRHTHTHIYIYIYRICLHDSWTGNPNTLINLMIVLKCITCTNTLNLCGLERSQSDIKLVRVMACCWAAPNNYLNPCWLIILEIYWQSPEGNFTGDMSAINEYYWLENYLFKMSFKSHRGEQVTECLEHIDIDVGCKAVIHHRFMILITRINKDNIPQLITMTS